MQAINASAPATLMVVGEHAVVYGHRAIVAAVEGRAQVELRPRRDQHINIFSALANHQTDTGTLAPHPKLSFAMATLRAVRPSRGLDLTIKSEIDHQMGLGSSAAITVALLAALRQHNDLVHLHREALQIIRTVQGRGSGADLAGALLGGFVAYDQNGLMERLPTPPLGLSLRYAGYKTPTAEVLALINERMALDLNFYQNLYGRMGTVSAQAIVSAQSRQWPDFYRALNDYEKLMEDLGVCDHIQKAQIEEARPHCAAVKISGSGLGDCIIALAPTPPAGHCPLTVDGQGLRLDFP